MDITIDPTFKRILLITRHFPPLVSGGARRSLLIAEGLKALGLEVTVATVAPAAGFDCIPVVHPMPEPPIGEEASTALKRGGSVKAMVRRHVLLPDPDIRWANRLVRQVKASAKDGFDAILTTSPPESIHYAGAKLAKHHGVPWLADFRDSWLADPLITERYHPLRRSVEAQLARHILKTADVVTAVSAPIVRELEALLSRPVLHMAQMVRPALPMAPMRNGRVNIGHTGSFSLSDPGRTIDLMLDVLEVPDIANAAFHLHLAGRLTLAEQERIARSAIAAKITLYGVLDYEASLALQAQMDALMLVMSPGTSAVPGKRFEYEQLGLPVFEIDGSGPAQLANGLEACLLSDFLQPTHTPLPLMPKTHPSSLDVARQILGALTARDRGTDIVAR